MSAHTQTQYIKYQPTKQIGGGGLDVAKYGLSIMVIAIHTKLFPEYLYPWLRIAVPLFFIISSYIFFQKIQQCTSKTAYIRKFVIRNLKLYGFWFCTLLPITLLIRDYFAQGILSGIFKMFLSFLFDSTFPASWFIMALVIAIYIVFSYQKYNKLLWLIALLCYTICCLKSNYANCHFIDERYIKLFPNFSFPAALIWVLVGKWFAEHELTIPTIVVCCGILLFSILLYMEHSIILYNEYARSNDCYFSLLFLVPCIFNLLQQIHVNESKKERHLLCRKLSTIYYCLHMSIALMITYLFKITGKEDANGLFCFLITFVICNIASATIIALTKRERFKWLKYAY